LADIRYAISVICGDEVGLVNRLTERIYNLSGNIEELYQGVLQGYFTITILASFSKDIDENKLKEKLEEDSSSSMSLSILKRDEKELSPVLEGEPYVLTVSCKDTPGVVSKVTAYLSGKGINIEDLNCITSEETFNITAHLIAPDSFEVKKARIELEAALQGSATNLNLMHSDIFRSTSRIDM
jgi:predicted amino acid-binding ACT domain protein